MIAGGTEQVWSSARGVTGRSAADTVRRCLVSGRSMPKAELIRFVVGPGDEIVPDISGKLPGRGLWLQARHDVLEVAYTRNHFARAVRRDTVVPRDLGARVEDLLVQRCQEIIGLARRAGEVVAGFERVREWLRAGRAEVVMCAADSADGSRRKLQALSLDKALIDLFSSDELAVPMGRPHVGYVAVSRGGLAARLLQDTVRLKGFRYGRHVIRQPTTIESRK